MLLRGSFDAEAGQAVGAGARGRAGRRGLGAALELARRLAAGPTAAYTEIKRALALGACRRWTPYWPTRVPASPGSADRDHQGAVAAFLAKQRTELRGRMTPRSRCRPRRPGRCPRAGRCWIGRAAGSAPRPGGPGPATAPAAGCRRGVAAGGRGQPSSTRGATTRRAWRTCPAPPGSPSRRSNHHVSGKEELLRAALARA